jgi:hypothetical protein
VERNGSLGTPCASTPRLLVIEELVHGPRFWPSKKSIERVLYAQSKCDPDQHLCRAATRVLKSLQAPQSDVRSFPELGLREILLEPQLARTRSDLLEHLFWRFQS